MNDWASYPVGERGRPGGRADPWIRRALSGAWMAFPRGIDGRERPRLEGAMGVHMRTSVF